MVIPMSPPVPGTVTASIRRGEMMLLFGVKVRFVLPECRGRVKRIAFYMIDETKYVIVK
jgi:hypothetical protein